MIGLSSNARTRVGDLLRGKALPVDEAQAKALLEALGGVGSEVDQGLRKYRRARQERNQPAESPRSPATSAPVPTQLPADLTAFTGRADHLAHLDRLLDATDPSPAAVVITAIAGTAGVGKTALAVHWAHRVRDRFPDGQLYVNLRGFDPSGTFMTPNEAICGFLDALDVSPQRIPSTLDAQVGLYRSLLAGKRILVVLDNARDAEQVRPLLPTTPTAMAVVTSRDQLTSLTAADGAQPMPLDMLSRSEAWGLLARRLGADRVEADPRATENVITACARLPLALTIVAARAQHTGFALEALAAELGDTSNRLDALNTGDTAAEARAVFSWSYTALTADSARLFRLLGLHPGPDICVAAAARLVNRPLRRIRRSLAELAHANLLTEHAPGRFSVHDLIRVYAAELAHDTDPESERHAALDRLLDHYLGTATGQPVSSWFTRELPNLVAAVNWAAAHRRTPAAIGLPAAVHEHLAANGPWILALDLHRTALAAAQDASHQTGQAGALINLADTQRMVGDHTAAAASARQALELYQRLGDVRGQATALHTLGRVQTLTGGHAAACTIVRQALDLYRQLGDGHGEALALHTLSHAQVLNDHFSDGVASLEQALDLSRRLGDVRGQALALHTLGLGQALTGQCPAATRTAEKALDLYRQLGDRHGQATSLNLLSRAQILTGDFTAAGSNASQAVELARQVGDRQGEAFALSALSRVECSVGAFAAATAAAEQALGLSQQIDYWLGKASALADLGRVQHATGDLTGGAANLRQALDLFREGKDLDGQAETHNWLGELLSSCADTPAAHQQFAAALDIARTLGTPHHEGRALEGLGDCALRDGRSGEGLAYLRQALAVYRRIGSPRTVHVETLLNHDPRIPGPRGRL